MSGNSEPGAVGDPVRDTLIAARLFAMAPHLFGGMVLRGAGPSRDSLVAALAEVLPCRRLPTSIDDARLMGGIDIAASLSAGKPVKQAGLLQEAAGGALVLPMAERCGTALAGRLSQALDAEGAALVLLDDGLEDDDAPPACLTERLAFHCDLSASREWEGLAFPPAAKIAMKRVAALDEAALTALASTAAALGVTSVRPLVFAAHTARAHAASQGRAAAIEADLAAAVRLVLAPRATALPQPPDQEQPPETPPPPPDTPSDTPQDSDADKSDAPLDDILIEAALASIPPDLLAQLAQGNAPKRSAASGSGKKKKSGLRGKPLGARPGMPRGGARLALMDTLRAAVPWQEVRRKKSEGENQGRADSKAASAITVRKEDLRIRRFEEKSARVTIFAVDASGSAAAARLAEAKGAVELMLSQAYVTRSEVALVAFRGDSAEVLLPPTRSLTRARRALAELPGGGGTPLAMGLNAAREAAEAVMARGRTASIVVLTDGRANIGADGAPGRKQAGEDADAAAKAIARTGIDALVVDISARPGREGPELAAAMEARFLALPRADAKALHAAIDAASPNTAKPPKTRQPA